MYIFETIFDLFYLFFVVFLGILILIRAKGNKEFTLFGWMAVILGCGDAFHLIPRVYSMWSPGGFDAHTKALGTGQFITSITMTIFYILLYAIWRQRYHIVKKHAYTAAILLCAVSRIVLCFFPQNAWTSKDAPLSWGIYRNIPFAIMGILILILFYQQAHEKQDKSFRFMWLAISLSFAFYAPVVLFADVFPPIGALMMPKTLAYVWIVWMGFQDLKNQSNLQ